MNAALFDDLGSNGACFVSDKDAIKWLSGKNIPHIFATRARKNRIDQLLISARITDWMELRARRDMRLLRKAIAASGLGPGDAILIHSSTIDNLLSARLFIEQADREVLPEFHIRIVYGGWNPEWHYSELRRMAALRREGVPVRFYCETEEMQQDLKRRIPGARFDVWVTPVSVDAATPPAEKSDPTKLLRVGLLGASRKGRGMEGIFALAMQLAHSASERSGPPIEILAQHLDEGRIATENASLGERVRMVSLGGILSADAFQEAIDRSHILLLLHDFDPHAIQGSGIVIDALLSGTPWISRRGLSMRSWRAAAGQLDAEDDAEFAEAILRVGAQYDRYRRGVLEARQLLIERHRERLASITRNSARNQGGSDLRH